MNFRGHQPAWRQALSYGALLLFALLYIFPFLITVATSFKTDADATAHPLDLLPHPATVQAWQEIFGAGGSASGLSIDFPRWLMNSAIVAVAITVGRVALDSMAGYALARLNFRGRKLVFGLIIATLAVPGVVLLIPRFLMLKQLGMYNTYWGMILPICADATGIFLMRQFFLQVPVVLEESGRIDGASAWQIYWRIVLPVVRAGLITLTIISFQGSWNEFQFYEIATVPGGHLQTLTTGLALITSGGLSAGNQFPLKLGGAALTILPIAVIFFVLQKYIVRGRLEGAVKG